MKRFLAALSILLSLCCAVSLQAPEHGRVIPHISVSLGYLAHAQTPGRGDMVPSPVPGVTFAQLAALTSQSNFQPANTQKLRRCLANVRTGTAPCIWAFVGNSTLAADGAGTGTNGFVGARALTPTQRLKQILTPFTQQTAAFTATGTGTSLAVTSVTGAIGFGYSVNGTGVPAGTVIVSQVSGTPGGAGTYITSNPTTSIAAPLTATSPIGSNLNTQAVGYFGDAGVTGGTGSYATYEPTAVLGSGWGSTGGRGFGGDYYANSTTTNALAFTPIQAFDTFDFWYAQASGRGTFTVNIDGGATLGTYNASSTTAMIKVTLSLPANSLALGTHTINFNRTTGGEVDILGVTTRNSTAPAVDIWNVGVAGAVCADWQSAVNPWAPFNSIPAIGADVIVLDIGPNNWILQTDLTAFSACLQALITSYAGSDVWIVNPVPGQVATYSNQAPYVQAILTAAANNNLPVVDIRNLFQSWEVSSPLGLYYNPGTINSTHPSNIGYAEIGALFAAPILSLP